MPHKACERSFEKPVGFTDITQPASEKMKMSLPKITIVTPSFNQAKYLPDTMNSVLTQDYPEVEYIVIDGGSTDGSDDLIRSSGDRLAYWCSEKDEGQADAIDKGFRRSTGEIMGWLNSDDILLPNALSTVAEYFQQHPEVEVVSGGAYCIDSEGQPLRNGFCNCTLGVPATSERFKYYELDGVFQPATFWRRSAYEAVGGVDPSWQFIMDRDLFFRLAARKKFGRLPELLACFRLHEDCKSMTIQDVRRDETQRFRIRYGVDPERVVLNSLIYYRYRIPSLLRKLWLRSLLTFRLLKVEAV